MQKLNQLKIVVLTAIILFNFLNSQESRQKEDITCKEAYDLIQEHTNDSNFVIIDFRPEKKYNKAHIKDAVFLDIFSANTEKILRILDKNKTYLIYCTIGNRSSIALKKMKNLNFKKLYHLYEGLTTWQEKGYNVIAKTKLK